jgi:hypothetical protein
LHCIEDKLEFTLDYQCHVAAATGLPLEVLFDSGMMIFSEAVERAGAPFCWRTAKRG